MKMSDIRVGMWLKPRRDVSVFGNHDCGIFVTQITERGFRYTTIADFPLGPRHGILGRTGEHLGIDGLCLYEQAP